MLTIQSDVGVILAYLNNLEDAKIKEAINGEFTLSFIATVDPLKTEFLYDNANLIEYGNDLFRVTQFEELHAEDNALTISVMAVHISYDLINNQFIDFNYTNKSAAEIMIQCLLGTVFTLTSTDVTTTTSIQYTEQCNSKQISMAIANNWQGELQYYRRDIQLLQQRGINRGVDFRFGKNLKSIKRIVNFADNTVSYEVDVQQGTELEELGYFELGDTVRVIDDALKADYEVRIVELEKDIISDMNSSVVLGSEIKDLRSNFASIKKEVAETKQIITDSASDWNKINDITNSRGEMILGKLNAITQVTSAIVNTTGTFEHRDNALYWQDQPTQEASTFATIWSAVGITFANSKTVDGEWIWISALDADGLTANKVTTSAISSLSVEAVSALVQNLVAQTITGVTIEGSTIYSGDRANGTYIAIASGIMEAYQNNFRVFTLGTDGTIKLYSNDGVDRLVLYPTDIFGGKQYCTIMSSSSNAQGLRLLAGNAMIRMEYDGNINIQGTVNIDGDLYSNNLG